DDGYADDGATRLEGTGRRQRRGATGQRPAGGRRGRAAGSGAGAFTRAAEVSEAALRRDRDEYRREGRGITRAEVSRTEHVDRGQGGGGVGKVIAAILLLAALGGGAFYVGRTYLGWGGRGSGESKVNDTVASSHADKGVSSSRRTAPKKTTPSRARRGRLHVKSSPPGAEIWICGKDSRQVTPAALTLRRGRTCNLELRLSGHQIYHHKVLIPKTRRSPLTVSAALIPKKRKQAKQDQKTSDSRHGQLIVTSIRVGTVLVNGRRAGSTPRLILDLVPGRYRVAVTFPSLGTSVPARWVTIRRGQKTKIHVDPEL
ncbi:MAG: PEGA domain-containing protein, partial [Deltaproteobacteria bacterium]|nr:PEGA domain-containing protein [Deltaproteobacteria bacterium]